MGTRRVRTPAGVMRFDKAIGQVIARRTRVNRAESIPSRSKHTPSQQVQRKRGRIREVDAQRDAALRGDRVPVDSPVLLQSPWRIAEARRTGNKNAVKSRRESLASARDRTTSASAQRAVSYNPLAGRFTTGRTNDRYQGTDPSGSRQVTRASAARAKARKAPVVAGYVGRRRAKD